MMKPEDPPPPYPGYATDGAGDLPPPYPGTAHPRSQLPQSVPVYIEPIIPHIAQQHILPGATPCPQCQVGGMQERPDVALIMCLVVMAFLFTPLTLCCIPCAFREQCSNCGYTKI